MVNVDVKDDTNEKIEEIARQIEHPATKKWVVGEAVDMMYEEVVE